MLMYSCNGFRKIIFVRNWQNLTLKSESETSFAGLQQNIQIEIFDFPRQLILFCGCSPDTYGISGLASGSTDLKL